MTSPAGDAPRSRRRGPRILAAAATLVAAVVVGLGGAAAVDLAAGSEADPTGSGTGTGTTEPTPSPDEATSPTTEPTPTDTSPTPTIPPVEPSTFTLVAAGDVLPHPTVLRFAAEAAAAEGRSGWDFSPLWAAMDPWVSGADLALCHLEVPLVPDGVEPSGYPLFGSPTSLATDLAEAGWDGCSTASNHAVDRGWTGVETTLDALDAAGLGHAGTARSAEEAAQPQLYVLDRGGRTVTVAQIAATYGTNGMPIPEDAPWSVQLIDGADLVARASAAREAGADLVVASIHWGTEYADVPDASQTALAAQLAASGVVDLVIGNHPHVPQRIELLDGGPDGAGMWVAYSLGNYISNQDAKCCRPQTGTGLLLSAQVDVPAAGPAHVSSVEWTAVPGDRVGGQRIYALPDLEAGRIDTPLLTLSSDELARRRQMVLDVVGDPPERTDPPQPTGEPPTVVPRS
ncbi:poly-gamma-glutamate synthesis protein (capsule biosynthesis protein) [Salana multivorans]|uniref:Poly-gamma-glutamate synthesis protein (Capsule biosynthesis protein) n=1 Tax=Salana multivorans TaxID=120377 RepID=A0A3N2D2K1_9MICO|nr:CapA family protein [Salana multivorans]ROR93888.1 poly-gamma-glutamate synthesis protein (capsule biosynthesis protein) [Salana multivorans]